jgi:hypothetical protein
LTRWWPNRWSRSFWIGCWPPLSLIRRAEYKQTARPALHGSSSAGAHQRQWKGSGGSGCTRSTHRALSAAWTLRARADLGARAALIAGAQLALVTIARAFVPQRASRIVGRTRPGPRNFENSLASGMLATFAHFEQPVFGFHNSPRPIEAAGTADIIRARTVCRAPVLLQLLARRRAP